jgi:hypothetical protein
MGKVNSGTTINVVRCKPKSSPPLHKSFEPMSLAEVLDILRDLQEEVRSLKRSRAPAKTPCKGTTAKGGECRNKCIPGSEYCRMHDGKPPPVPKVPKEKKTKVKRVQPEHVHDDPNVPCRLCESHGDATMAEMPEETFESADGDISERLRELLRVDAVACWADDE